MDRLNRSPCHASIIHRFRVLRRALGLLREPGLGLESIEGEPPGERRECLQILGGLLIRDGLAFVLQPVLEELSPFEAPHPSQVALQGSDRARPIGVRVTLGFHPAPRPRRETHRPSRPEDRRESFLRIQVRVGRGHQLLDGLIGEFPIDIPGELKTFLGGRIGLRGCLVGPTAVRPEHQGRTTQADKSSDAHGSLPVRVDGKRLLHGEVGSMGRPGSPSGEVAELGRRARSAPTRRRRCCRPCRSRRRAGG